jgi:phage baseplate assembly protein W
MAVPKQIYRVDPRDLNKNVAVGISLPFNGPRVFNSTYSTKEQVKHNLINVLLTNKGERVLNPDFGSDLRRVLFEFISDDNMEGLKSIIIQAVGTYIPEIEVRSMEISPEPDSNTVNVRVNYQMRLSGDKDSILISFE